MNKLTGIANLTILTINECFSIKKSNIILSVFISFQLHLSQAREIKNAVRKILC